MTTPNQKSETQTDAWPPAAKREKPLAERAETAGDEASQPDLLTELVTSVYRAEGMAAQGFAMLRERVEALERRLFGDTETAQSTDSQTSADPSDELRDTPNALGTAPGQVVAEVVQETAPHPNDDVATFPELPPDAAPTAQPAPVAQPVPQPVQPVRDVRPANVSGGDMEGLIFGSDLANHPSYSSARQTLVQALRHGDEDALGLAGEILIIRSATMDRLPALLKDIGEAWYRWPGGTDVLRDALIAWLHARLDAVGLGNRIALVRVGDRYDSKRHNAKARGVEVTGVHGWVVLRDNGNVYTKATVTVA